MLSVIGFVKTDVITHCWQSCALSRDSKRNHPLHTHTHGHTCWRHWCIVQILPWMLWVWQGREDPWFMGIQRLHDLVLKTALLARDAVLLTSNLLFFLQWLQIYHVENVELQPALNCSGVVLHEAIPLHYNEFLGIEHFPLHQLCGQLCLWKCLNPKIWWFDWNRGRVNDTCQWSLVSNYLLPPPPFFFLNSRQKKSVVFNLVSLFSTVFPVAAVAMIIHLLQHLQPFLIWEQTQARNSSYPSAAFHQDISHFCASSLE